MNYVEYYSGVAAHTGSPSALGRRSAIFHGHGDNDEERMEARTKLQQLPAGDLEMWAFPMAEHGPGISGTLLSVPGVPSAGNSTVVYFSCEDCAVEAARAAAQGGGVRREKMSIGQYGFIALVTDTEGNMIGLHSMK